MASSENNPQYQNYMAGFPDAFQKLGWAEGRNIQIDYRWAAFDAKLMERFSKELLALRPEVHSWACSAFTRVTACTLALSPIRDTLSEGFSHFVTSIAAPAASGW